MKTNTALSSLLSFLGLAFPLLAGTNVEPPADMTLTDLTVPGGTVYAIDNGYQNTETPAKLFDNVVNADKSRWLPNAQSSAWIVYQFDSPTLVNAYRICNGYWNGGKRAPRDFTIDGSNDGENWTNLDTRTGEATTESDWPASTWRYYTFDNSTAYSRYRLTITKTSLGERIQLNEMELFCVVSGGILTVSGAPANVGTPAPDYGMQTGLGGTTVPFTAPQFSTVADEFDEAGSTHYVYSGYRVSRVSLGGDAEVLAQNTDSAFSYLVPTDANLLVEWLFGRDYRLDTSALPDGTGNVAIKTDPLSGPAFPAEETWYREGSTVTLEAVPAAGQTFLTWTGDIPEGVSARVAQITFAMDRSVSLQGVFLPVGALPVQYVATTGDDANSGFKESTARKTVEAALQTLDAIGEGTLVVAPGVYPFAGPHVLTNAITLCGSTGNPADVVITNTVSSGYNGLKHNRRVLTVDHPDAFVHSVTLAGGRLTECTEGGAGVLIGTNGGTVSNCVVRNCAMGHNYDRAGGVYITGDKGLLTHSIVEKNTLAKDCSWSNMGYYGAAVAATAGRIENCLIRDNGATLTAEPYSHTSSCAVYITLKASIANCTIVSNTCTRTGGMYLNKPDCGATNCVVAGNTCLYRDTEGEYLDAWSGTQGSQYVHCALDTAEPIGVGNFAGTVETFFRDYAGGDLRPALTSPLLNHGAPLPDAPATDLAGNPRVIERIDIGAFEAPASATTFFIK